MGKWLHTVSYIMVYDIMDHHKSQDRHNITNHLAETKADVKYIYRMILIVSSQLCLQRIHLKDNANDPLLKTYRLKTVTSGTVSVSYFAMRTLKQLPMREESSFSEASPILLLKLLHV
ncbi:hypothetical protein CEXT_511971 [Caerostris extrusa]|uniref:Uncharacterized protein n=1 Tax=Caerostris extrusa TaxID=172846 RepID=A0AAV4RDX9_CAEEX|nr:hypothetical protein CEXT_511971 [Caerostris extrusa]